MESKPTNELHEAIYDASDHARRFVCSIIQLFVKRK